MTQLLDSSILVAALIDSEEHHQASALLVKQRDTFVSNHGLLETFSTLTGGRLGFRADASDVATCLSEMVANHLEPAFLPPWRRRLPKRP